jgi:hypothetical protein
LKRKALIAILLVVIIGVSGGAWYYFSRVSHSSIEKILSNPKDYEGKTVTIEGEVTDRTSFFVFFKFYKVKDKTGEITVVTKRSLPAAKSEVRVSGRIDEAFPIGDQKLVVFQEESAEEKARKENK